MILGFSTKQSSVSLSKDEEEDVAICSSSYEAIWIPKLMSGLFEIELDPKMILCDN